MFYGVPASAHPPLAFQMELVDLAEWFGRPETGGQGEFVDLVHVTPEGNRLKAERIAEALLEAGLLEP